MNPDGSNKLALPAGVAGEPSRLLHGGHRWFLEVQDVPGQTYPSQSSLNTRREIVAVRDDGNPAYAVMLTTQVDLETNGNVRWLPGDGQVSWVARRWSGAQIVEAGVYSAAVNFDGAGNVTGLAAQPLVPTIATSLVPWTGSLGSGWFQNDLGPDLLEYDWAPSATQVAYGRFSATELRIATVGGGDALVYASPWIRMPVWSPDGSKIAFKSSPGNFGGLYTISPAGANLKRIVKNGTQYSVERPAWSPTGSHLVYARFNSGSFAISNYFDVYRITAVGTGEANLTSTVGTALPIAWR